jgi:hypothetical protein
MLKGEGCDTTPQEMAANTPPMNNKATPYGGSFPKSVTQDFIREGVL